MCQKLVQFQCGKEGSLFYYQSVWPSEELVKHCPICGSRRVKRTGREYPGVDENEAIRGAEVALAK